ncbi:MAG: biotin/lipoate A/B protein ligase family protein [Candidatus Krumholzibacteriia bacterium]
MSSRSANVLRVLLEPGLTGAENMRRDTGLLEAQDEESPPALRLYTWEPAAISLGFMQRAEELVDLDACRAAGIDVVRRPTGGRTILHWEEITYAVVASTRDARFGAHLGAAHAVIGECLAAGLAHLGIATELSRPLRDPQRRLLRQPCFVSAGRSELLVGGRKLLGSAQRRRAQAFLQHGSLLVGSAHVRLVEFLLDTRGDPRLAATMQRRLGRDTTTLGDLLGRRPAFEELTTALVRGFSERLGLVPELVDRTSLARL